MNTELILSTFVAIFVMADPFGNIPVFLSLTAYLPENERRSAMIRASVLATAILALFAVSGPLILRYLVISLEALRIAGGLLTLIVGVRMVYGPIDQAPEGDGNVALTPMATPLLAGPGALTLIAVFMNDAAGLDKAWVFLSALGGMASACSIILLGSLLARFMGQNVMALLSRLMGILICGISIEMILVGLRVGLGINP
ncbi:MAG: MarC family protein [Proteobacteria bacterium]|nr:MarC family protein [Pseudomonadota bacterium]